MLIWLLLCTAQTGRGLLSQLGGTLISQSAYSSTYCRNHCLLLWSNHLVGYTSVTTTKFPSIILTSDSFNRDFRVLFFNNKTVLFVGMPSSKKAPSMARKKVTASARARISSRNIRKDTHKDLNESYIQVASQPQVSTMSSSSNPDPDPRSMDSSNAILSMLTELSESNRALLSRIERVEQRQSTAAYAGQTPPRPYGSDRFSHLPSHIVGREEGHRHVQLPPFNAT